MSTVKANSHQVGQSVTAANNFTLYQPTTPDGTVRLGVGNAGATTADILIANSSGNLGLGVTPSSWYAGYKAIETGSGSLVYPASATTTQLWNNLYINTAGNVTYKATGIGGLYSIGGGGNSHVWYSAPSGTTGTTATLTQAMTLDASGNLLVGTTSTSGSTSNSAKLVTGQMKTAAGTSATSTSATTIFSLSTPGVYYVYVNWSASNSNAFDAFAIILYDGSSARIALSSNGSQILISLSGTNVQVTNNFNTATVNWSYMVQSNT